MPWSTLAAGLSRCVGYEAVESMSATSRRCFHAGTREDSKWVARDPRVWPWRWLAVWLSGSFRLRTSSMAVEDGKAVMQRLGSQSASAAERQRGRRYGDCCTTLGAGTSWKQRGRSLTHSHRHWHRHAQTRGNARLESSEGDKDTDSTTPLRAEKGSQAVNGVEVELFWGSASVRS